MIDLIIPVYNQAQQLGQCLASIQTQTLPAARVIVVDDGSTDDVAAAIQPFRNRLPITLQRQPNRGAAAARNAGAGESSAPLIVFCDADVVLRTEFLAKLHAALDHSTASFAYSSFRFGKKNFSSFPFDLQRLRRMPYIHTTALIRREHFPGFDETLQRLQDWDLWLTMAEQGRTGVWVPEVLFTVQTGGTMSEWFPKILYRLPWLPMVRRYNDALAVIKRKHHLSS